MNLFLNDASFILLKVLHIRTETQLLHSDSCRFYNRDISSILTICNGLAITFRFSRVDSCLTEESLSAGELGASLFPLLLENQNFLRYLQKAVE